MSVASKIAIGAASVVCVVVVFATAVSPAFGAERETQSRSIDLRLLDLTSPHDQAVLLQRIHQAARTLCERPEIRDLSGQSDLLECRAAAESDAMIKARTVIAAANAHRNFADGR